MKKLALYFLQLLFCIQLHSQAQFTNNGNIHLYSGASITFFGNFNNNGTVVDSGQAVTFKGSSAQTISGTSQTAFNNLVLNNSSGVSLQQSVSVINSLVLTAGPLQLN
ncbi:MAG TPA: hypothetical protein VFJ43_08360, partial [Bacteroidia bacterium]|nr:hypothetical protein [Bacteroidia bacterium]